MRILLIAASMLLSALVIITHQAATAQQEQKNGIQQGRNEESLPGRDIELTITPISYDDHLGKEVATDQYKVGAFIEITLTMTNHMEHPTEVGWGDDLFQNRLKLLRDGQEVPYLSALPDKLANMDKYGYQGSMRPIKLQPNVPQRIGSVELRTWYPPLEVGHYQLEIKHRFFGGERPVYSNTVTFEVIP